MSEYKDFERNIEITVTITDKSGKERPITVKTDKDLNFDLDTDMSNVEWAASGEQEAYFLYSKVINEALEKLLEES